MADAAGPVELRGETLAGFADYIRRIGDVPETEARCVDEVRQGKIVAEPCSRDHPVQAPNGLIHDWIGATWVCGATLAKTLAVIQDYDRHKEIYRPEVIDSKLVSRTGDDFKIFLRLLKRKIITVVLDTHHSVHYGSIDASHRYCRSVTTRVCEVHDAGKPTEKILPPDTGYGFLWRLNSYWRFEESAGGVYLECRAISLTRDVPKKLRWVIEPLVRKLPKESLIDTLAATRRALTAPQP